VIRTQVFSNRPAIETARTRFVFCARGNRSGMVGELITLPVRIGVRATRLWLRAAEETLSVATTATGRLIALASRGSDQTAAPQASPPERNGRSGADGGGEGRADNATTDKTSTSPGPGGGARPPRPTPLTPPSDGPAAPPQREPLHVSEEPSLVEEFAEPGAEDGAGAEIRVQEPWDQYREMSAKQIVGRLGSATPAELAAVQLYESSHRRRQTILNAVQRELRTANGRSSK
jgi:hypothetical protein